VHEGWRGIGWWRSGFGSDGFFIHGDGGGAEDAAEDGLGGGLEEEGFGGFFGELLDACLQGFDFFGLIGGEILFFVGIGLEIEEFDTGGEEGAPDEFPGALAEGGAVGFEVVDDFVAAGGTAFGEGREDVAAVEGLAGGGATASEMDEGGEHVDDMDEVAEFAAAGDVAGPSDEGGDAGAALVELAFAAVEGAVVAGDGFDIALAGHAGVAGAAVVAVEDDEGVLAHAFGFERGEDTADFVVETGDHAGVGAAGFVGDVGVAFDVVLGCLIGCVGGGEGEVHEERGGGVVALEASDGVGTEELGSVAFLLDGVVVALPVEDVVGGVGEVVDLAEDGAVVVVEAALAGPVFAVGMTEVPFADHFGAVAGGFEEVGEGALRGVEAIGAFGGDDDGLEAVAEGVAAGHDGGAGGGAEGEGVELFQAGAVGGEVVDVRGFDVGAAVEADVFPAEVVGDDVEDVGFGRGFGADLMDEAEGEQEEGGVEGRVHELRRWCGEYAELVLAGLSILRTMVGMPTASSSVPVLSHSRRLMADPDAFSDVASGIQLEVDFQRRQERVSRVEQFQTAEWAVDLGEANVATRVRGVLMGGWASMCVVQGPGMSTWNGLAGEPGSVCLLPPGEELDGRTEPGFSWVTVAVPPEVWERCRRVAGVEGKGPERLLVRRLPAGMFAAFQGRLAGVQAGLRGGVGATGEAGRFVEDCFTAVCELAREDEPVRDLLRNRARLARRAEAWMREHLAEPVQVPEVCLALRVSRRELEYAFRWTFDQSPRDCLQKLRLNAVRRHLLRAKAGETSILSVTHEHGLTHLGRFSANYRALFGERPVETLRGAGSP
jgi:AraC-like DNA-binding protein